MSVKIYISVREDGTKFRPSDWPEMLAGIACTVNDSGRIQQSNFLFPVYTQRGKGICIDDRLKQENQLAYEQAMYFVTTNRLRLDDD